MRPRPNVGLLLAHCLQSLIPMQWAHNVGLRWKMMHPSQTLPTPTWHMLCNESAQDNMLARDIQECPENFHQSSAPSHPYSTLR